MLLICVQLAFVLLFCLLPQDLLPFATTDDEKVFGL